MGADGLEDIGDVGDIEIIEVELPLEPVPMQDCCLQVRSTFSFRKEHLIAF